MEMAASRAVTLWYVNVASFLIFVLLAVTGTINWLVLPRGYESGSGTLRALRHVLCEVHAWAAVLFAVVVMVHLVLHWGYVRANLKQYGLLK
jgi:hypothetical protein